MEGLRGGGGSGLLPGFTFRTGFSRPGVSSTVKTLTTSTPRVL